MIKPSSAEPSLSLPEVHGSVPTAGGSVWRRMFAFAGPAYLVSVGYMDPGNWATDLEGGARFGYSLLWVLVMSNLMAILLQTLSSRLGIVAGRDLAQACRESYPRHISWMLWILCETAIAACDLAEVLGAAIGLNLLFGVPMLAGVLLTSLDTLFLLWFSRFGIRVVEAFILLLVVTIGVCFGIEVFLAKPVVADVFKGLVPYLNGESLYVAIGILGATVMPHNLYLHSALVQTRRIGTTVSEKRSACRYNLLDSAIALNGALFVNAAILIVAASVFFQRGIQVTEIQQAHLLLSPLMGTAAASVLFAFALLCSGQSSTLTGTMAGQIIMEGFLNFRMRPWLRRLITRSLAIVPAAVTIFIAGDKASYKLLILSQVILSLQLPFAVIPLIHFTSDTRRMGAFANRMPVRILAWTAATIIVGLNLKLVYDQISGWTGLASAVAVPVALGLLLLLAWVTFEPWMPSRIRSPQRHSSITLPSDVAVGLGTPVYKRILVPLDHTERDRTAIQHAAALARSHGAKLFLLHVEEGVTSQVYGSLSRTAEVEAGRSYLDGIVAALHSQGLRAEAVVCHSNTPRKEIVRVTQMLEPDLLIMGAHGHSGLKDLIFGTTINAVRHAIKVPILVVRR